MKSKTFKLFLLSLFVPTVGMTDNLKPKYWSPWSALPLEHRYRFSPHRIEFPTELIFEFHDFCNQTMEVRLKSYNKDENNFVCACVMDNFRLFNTDAEYEVERMKEIKGSKWEHVKRGPDDPSPVPLFAKYWFKCLLKREEILSKIGRN